MHAVRRFVLAGPAGIVTLMLFHVMQSLVSVELELNPEPYVRIPELVRVRVDSTPPPPRGGRPMRPVVASAPPPPGPPTGSDGGGPGAFTIAQPIDPVETAARSGPVLGVADGEAVPLVRVQPPYPPGALRQRREGRVLVELTIGPNGAVERARVIAAEPAGLFEEAALKAVSQWKYSPRVENGVAVPQHGVRTTIVFALEHARS